MFMAPCGSNDRFVFNSVAGRYVVLCFVGAGQGAGTLRALEAAMGCRQLFDDRKLCLFWVASAPEAADRGVGEFLPGIRWFRDFDRSVARLYGVEADPRADDEPSWLVLDPTLRVLKTFASVEAGEVMQFLSGLPAVEAHAGVEMHAPALVVPRVFDPGFCRLLISLYETHGGQESGFMRDVGGRTVSLTDPGFKRRSDYRVTDEGVCQAVQRAIVRRLLPEIRKAFQFQASRIERYVVACYDSRTGGYFRPHRDNTTLGTAHRKFAVSINLDAEGHTGGDLRFPEFGPRTYRPPTGGAVVFSCSLLHEATPVTGGRRYAFLPFLYDEAGARHRQANRRFLAVSGTPDPPSALPAQTASTPGVA